jgi:hypothetical protein
MTSRPSQGRGAAGAAAPDLRHAHLLADVTFDPVFIIGDHRSGTTVLYQLLSLTAAFNVVTAYHVIRYDEILENHVAGRTAQAENALADEFARIGLADRVIDGVRVTPDLPEEYGFVIDPSSRPRLRPETRPRLLELCGKVRLTGGDRPILLKNPWDVLGFAYVKQVFPSARFVFIHRHPLNVMSSQLEATRSLFRSRNEYVALLSPWYRRQFERPGALRVTRLMSASRFGIGARIAGRHVTKVARYYLASVGGLPARDYVELRYEDLCTRPDATLQRLLAFLDVKAARDVRARDVVRPRGAPVLPEIQRRYRTIRHDLADYCARQGYDVDR